jgi:hypothetical protein
LFNKVKLFGNLGSIEKCFNSTSNISYFNYDYLNNVVVLSNIFLKSFLNFLLKMIIGVIFG